MCLTMMMSVAGPIKLQIKYVSNLNQHLEIQKERETSHVWNKTYSNLKHAPVSHRSGKSRIYNVCTEKEGLDT